ncbi:MAG: MG2 domain-containing protein [Bacteroidia bacterium]|nr:MG2 domain-containing protein [Bacteroidia bacterium]
MKKVFFLFLAAVLSIMGINLLEKSGTLPQNNDLSKTIQALWKKVEEAEQNGKPQTALENSKKIYSLAKAGKLEGEAYKALCHIFKFTKDRDDYNFHKTITWFEAEAAKFNFPYDAFLLALAGDAVIQFADENRWETEDISENTDDEKSDSLAEQSTETLLKRAVRLYKKALEKRNKLLNLSFRDYPLVFEKGNEAGHERRGNLYTILSHRILSFLTTYDVTGVKLEWRESIGEEWFMTADQFVQKAKVKTFDAIENPEDLLSFLIKDNIQQLLSAGKQNELMDFDLFRYTFLKNHSGYLQHDSVFVNMLDRLLEFHKNNKYISELVYEKAVWLKYYAENAQLNTGSRNGMMKDALALLEKHIKGENKGNAQCKHLYEELKEQNIFSMITESAWEPGKPAFLTAKVKNISKLYFRIYKANEQDFYLDKFNFYEKEKWKKFITNKPLLEFSREWKSFNDYLPENVCMEIPGLDYGKYIIVACINPDFQPLNNKFQVMRHDITRITMVKRDMNGMSICKVLDRFNGQEIKNIKAEVLLKQYDNVNYTYYLKKIKEYQTDANGEFKLDIGNGHPYYNNFYVALRKDNDVFYSACYIYYHNEENQEKISSVMLTDRAVYRPGQKVYFKSVVFQRDNFGKAKELRKNQPITITVKDANGEIVKELSFTTNDFGAVSGEFNLPIGKLNGYFTISDGFTQKGILVEEYKRPTFYVETKPVENEYAFGENVRIPFKIQNYAGYAMKDVKVKFEIKRTISDYFYSYYRCWFPMNNVTKIIHSGELATNENGEAWVEFKPEKSPNHTPTQTYVYEISVNAVATNGESHEGLSMLYVSEYPYNLSLASDNEFFTDEGKSIMLKLSNLNGAALKNKDVDFKIFKLDEQEPRRKFLGLIPDIHTLDSTEFLKKFPYDEYVKQSTKENKKMKLVKEGTVKTDTSGNANLGVIIKEGGKYIIKAVVPGTKNKLWHEFGITAINPNENSVGADEFLKLCVRKKSVEPGSQINHKIYTSLKNIPFYSDFCSYGNLFNAEKLTQNSGWKNLAVKEEHRGGIYWSVFGMYANRFFHSAINIDVPFSNKKLTYELISFRSKTEPASEEKWKIRFLNPDKSPARVLLASAMYDASLDEFASNSFYHDFNMIYNKHYYWSYGVPASMNSYLVSFLPYKNVFIPLVNYPNIKDYDYYAAYSRYRGIRGIYNMNAAPVAALKEKADAEAKVPGEVSVNGSLSLPNQLVEDNNRSSSTASNPFKNTPKPRTNFNETAFFFPELKPNTNGEITLDFKMPDALTRWKWLNFAYTEDFKSVYFEQFIEAKKELMVRPNLPRFLLAEDTIIIKAEIVNLSGNNMNVSANIEFFDLFTNKILNADFLISGEKAIKNLGAIGQTALAEWKIKVPLKMEMAGIRIFAKSSTHTDGEESVLPVLPNRLVLTESYPFTVRDNKPFAVNFKKPLENNSASLIHKNFTLEYCPEPIWYAIQSMPYLMEYPYECAEQTFSRFYANSVSAFIMKKYPSISKAIQAWDLEKETTTSLLERNPELKQILLEETPWVMAAKNEKARKQNLKILMDVERMGSEIKSAEEKLKELQLPGGAFSWFKGGTDNAYITAYICEGYGHLHKLKIIDEIPPFIQKAVLYLDKYYKDVYKEIVRYDKNYKTNNHLSSDIIHYLYTRSYFKTLQSGVFNEEFMKYFHEQGKKYWMKNNTYMKGMLGLYFIRMNETKTHRAIMASLKEYAIKHADLGIYWKENYTPHWTNAPIEMQSLLIELFHESGEGNAWVDEMQNWLLKHKQTHAWSNTKSPCAAIYALLLNKNTLPTATEFTIDWNGTKEQLNNFNDFKTSSGTGYYVKNVQVNSTDQLNTLCNAQITKSSGGISWGALYWQYEEEYSKVKKSDAFGLSISRELLVRKSNEKTEKWQTFKPGMNLELGDKIRVKIIIKTDRDYEFIHIKDIRPSGCDPSENRSGYYYQNGLGYYMNIKDASTNFFMDYLRKGNYVLEYDIKLNNSGIFQMAPVQIQCMYAPEFRAFGNGQVLKCMK